MGMTTPREVGYVEASLAVVAATFAIGKVAPDTPSERKAWLNQVSALAAELGPVVKAVRLDLMRTVKEILVEGILEVPSQQNNANRVVYTVNSGGKYADSLWTPWLEGEALERERRRLMSMHGRRVRLVKVTQVDFDHEGHIKLDDKGVPELRSFAKGGVITEQGAAAVDEDQEPAAVASASGIPAESARPTHAPLLEEKDLAGEYFAMLGRLQNLGRLGAYKDSIAMPVPTQETWPAIPPAIREAIYGRAEDMLRGVRR